MKKQTKAQKDFDTEMARLGKLAANSDYLNGSVDILTRYLFEDGGGYKEREQFFPIFNRLLKEKIKQAKGKYKAR